MTIITIPPLYEYRPALISWNSAGAGSTYRLERVFNGDFKEDAVGGLTWEEWESFNGTWQDFENHVLTWEQFDGVNLGITWEDFEKRFPTWQVFENTVSSWKEFEALKTSAVIYEGDLTEYTDTMIKGGVTAIYRLTVFPASGEPETTTSELVAITPNRPPVITLIGNTGTFLGSVYKAFSFEVSFFDPDPDSLVSFEAKLDNSILLEQRQNVQQNVKYQIVVSDEQVNMYQENDTGTVIITATDQWGATSTVHYTFQVIEDFRKTTLYYILRDGEPIAKSPSQTQNFLDYTAVGEHKYKIRAVDRYDNFVDSNEITLFLEIEYATVAPVDTPWDQVNLIQRRGSLPSVERSFSPVFGKQHISGQAYALIEDEGFRESVWTLAFTHRSLATKEKINRWAAEGIKVVYRDTFGNKIVGVIQSVDDGYVFKNKNGVAVDFSIQLSNIPYSEVITYD